MRSVALAAMSERIRLDALLTQRGLFPSRSRAAAAVMAGDVRLCAPGARTAKPGQMVLVDAEVEVTERARYVSRGGIKLENALGLLSLDVSGRRCLDAGASTGGFTDCLLQGGAAEVIAVDVGYGELAWSLREARDPRALAVAEDAWKRAPNAAQVADTLGTILIDGGDASRGLALFKRAMELAPEVPQYRLKYAQALARQGASIEAKAAIEPLLRDFPGSPQADAARALSNRL